MIKNHTLDYRVLKTDKPILCFVVRGKQHEEGISGFILSNFTDFFCYA